MSITIIPPSLKICALQLTQYLQGKLNLHFEDISKYFIKKAEYIYI